MAATIGLIDEIYEAAVLRERWPTVLQRIADNVGAGGGILRSGSPDFSDWIASPRAEEGIPTYVAEGWADDDAYAAPFFAEMHPGFRTETDYRTEDELERLPVYREHLVPRGAIAGAGTIVQCAADHLAVLTFEGFASHAAAKAAIPILDALRPHLARAVTVSALRPEQAAVVTDSLALAGAAAAVIDRTGRLRAANDLFVRRMADIMVEGAQGVRFRNAAMQARFRAAIESRAVDPSLVRTIAVHDAAQATAFALHILPITGAARDLCGANCALLLVSEARNRSVPSADLLRLLFDLTPAEARLTRRLLEGATIADAALSLSISSSTARTQLHAVFGKTGIARQAELMLALGGLAPPRSDDGSRDH